jgi:hypothetical protein
VTAVTASIVLGVRLASSAITVSVKEIAKSTQKSSLGLEQLSVSPPLQNPTEQHLIIHSPSFSASDEVKRPN